MKKILIGFIVVLSVFLIYLGFRDDNVYYLAMGDYIANGINPMGIKDYGYTDYIKDNLKADTYVNIAKDNNRIIDLINAINDNVDVAVNRKRKTLQNALIKADLVTISIGMNDIINTLSFDYNSNDLYNRLEQVMNDYEELFKVLRKYCKEKIYLTGLYNTTGSEELNNFFTFADNKIKALADKYKIKYVSISDLHDYLESKFYPNKQGYEMIANKIIDMFRIK